MTTKTKVLSFVQKYTMIIALVLVTAFFTWRTNGKLLMPQNLTNIISQNAYVFVLATGMLLCILTGGNIDLSVGSVVCFVGTVGAVLMRNDLNMWLAVLVMLVVGLLIGAWQAFWEMMVVRFWGISSLPLVRQVKNAVTSTRAIIIVYFCTKDRTLVLLIVSLLLCC